MPDNFDWKQALYHLILVAASALTAVLTHTAVQTCSCGPQCPCPQQSAPVSPAK